MKQLRYIVVDVDGTMTDGGIYYDNNGNEWKKFQVRDAMGFLYFHEFGIKTILLTGRYSEAIERRAKELQISEVFQKITEKEYFLQDYIETHHISQEEIGYIGDDLNDFSAMKLCGFVACPKDACDEVKEIANYISEKEGGQGVIRDVANYLKKETDAL